MAQYQELYLCDGHKTKDECCYPTKRVQKKKECLFSESVFTTTDPLSSMSFVKNVEFKAENLHLVRRGIVLVNEDARGYKQLPNKRFDGPRETSVPSNNPLGTKNPTYLLANVDRIHPFAKNVFVC